MREMAEGGEEGRGGQAHGWGSDQGFCERGRGEGFTPDLSLIPDSLLRGGRGSSNGYFVVVGGGQGDEEGSEGFWWEGRGGGWGRGGGELMSNTRYNISYKN
jgi:hypothetical protein